MTQSNQATGSPPVRFQLTTADERELCELLRAVERCTERRPSTADLAGALQWPRSDVLAGLREARLRGLVTGAVKNRATVELVDIALKPSAADFLRRHGISERRPPDNDVLLSRRE